MQSNVSTWVTSVTCQYWYCCSSSHQSCPNCIYGNANGELSWFQYNIFWPKHSFKELIYLIVLKWKLMHFPQSMFNQFTNLSAGLLKPLSLPVSSIRLSPESDGMCLSNHLLGNTLKQIRILIFSAVFIIFKNLATKFTERMTLKVYFYKCYVVVFTIEWQKSLVKRTSIIKQNSHADSAIIFTKQMPWRVNQSQAKLHESASSRWGRSHKIFFSFWTQYIP